MHYEGIAPESASDLTPSQDGFVFDDDLHHKRNGHLSFYDAARREHVIATYHRAFVRKRGCWVSYNRRII